MAFPTKMNCVMFIREAAAVGRKKERMWPWTSHRFCQNLYCLQNC